METPKEKEKEHKLYIMLELVNSGSELERVEKIHKNELKKYHNHEGETDANYSKQYGN